MPRKTPEQFQTRLEEIAEKAGIGPDELTNLEQINLIMVQTMYPRDEMFRMLIQLFVVVYAQIRHSRELISTLNDLLYEMAVKTRKGGE